MTKLTALRQEGYELLHNGVIELSAVEANGIRIDLKRLEKSKSFIDKEMRQLRHQLEEDKVGAWRVWRKRYGAKANLSSREQLGVVLGTLGYKLDKRTSKGNIATDDEALAHLGDDPFITKLRKYFDYSKAVGTFITGIEREIRGDRIHPVFNLHLVITFRSSSDSPNFQNFPVRDKEIAQLVRSLFIPSPKSCIVENDFKGIEVGVSACYHKDPMFIKDITTPGRDMHRDMAAEIYLLDTKQVSKDARYGAKNKFVFPQFYGQKWPDCAPNLWEWIDKGKLQTMDGMPLYEHLKAQGIKKLGEGDFDTDPQKGTFTYHVKQVEQKFWGERFKGYDAWKRRWFNSYLERGYFDFYTGFRSAGNFTRNQVNNAPIQGSAFHCLLWTLIQVNRKLRKYQMKSKVVGQIHDSLIGDVRVDEMRQYLEIVHQTATVELRKHYPWLIVPLEIEFEITPEEGVGTWFDKKEVHFKDGKFKHPTKDVWTTDAQKFVSSLNHLHVHA